MGENENRKKYEFEKSQRSYRRNPENAISELHKLKENINIGEDDKRFDNSLLEFITHYHLNIEWYHGKLNKEGRKRTIFFWLSAILLLTIPVVIYLTSLFFNGTTITAQITTVLTGLIGFHNVVGKWLEKRNTMAAFHEAATNLKKNLFDFEREWKHKQIKQPLEENNTTDSDLAVDENVFRTSILNSIEKARGIEAEEEKKFFEKTIIYPSIDLGSVLSASTTAGKGIVQKHIRKLSEAEKNLLEAEQNVREKEALVNGYCTLIASQEAKMSGIQDTKEKESLRKVISTHRVALQKEEVALLQALALMKKYQ